MKLGLNKDDGKYYAIKIIKDTSHIDSNIKAIMNEAKVLQQLDHPNIISIYDVENEGKYEKPDGKVRTVLFAVLQLAQGGEIFDYLANTGRFSEPVARYYFKQMIDSLDHCHSKGFAHRDLKPENLLLDEKFNLLLADFGFATLLSGKDGSGKLRSILGTESYMAPEIHSKAPYVGTSVDLFAAGIILFIFITGHPPFNQAKPTDLYYNLICMNNHEKFWAAHSRRKPGGLKFFSPEFISLMNCLLAFDPTQRPSLSEIKAHPWYNGETCTSEEIFQEFSQRKAKVDKLLERQRIALERKKAMAAKKKKQANMAFNAPNIFRDIQYEGDNAQTLSTKNFDDRTQVLDSLKDLPEIELQRQDGAGLVTNGEVYSVMEPKELYETAICAAFNATNQVTAKPEKLSVSQPSLTFLR